MKFVTYRIESFELMQIFFLQVIVSVRKKSRYNQLSQYQIIKIEIYLSSYKH